MERIENLTSAGWLIVKITVGRDGAECLLMSPGNPTFKTVKMKTPPPLVFVKVAQQTIATYTAHVLLAVAKMTYLNVGGE